MPNMPPDDVKMRACDAIDAEGQPLIELSDDIHAHPELMFEEHRAAQRLTEYLERAGFEVQRAACGLDTAFVARVGSGEPRVAVLCEYDALPHIGHACGHNIIAACGVGAGAGLASVVGEIGGTVLVLGTPAEEGGGGKIKMARAGAFDGVDAAMMVHPAGADLAGMNVLAVCEIEVEYKGVAAHAAAFPERGVNALDALITAYNSIAQLRQHIRPTERIHGIITDGGQAANIVPAHAAGLFFVRAATEEQLAELKKRVLGCFEAGASATGACLSMREVGEPYSDMWTNEPLAAAYTANMARLGRTVRQVSERLQAVAGSTDMGNVSKIVPSIHPMIAVSPPDVPLHSEAFTRWAASDAAHRAVLDGAKALAMTAIDVLTDAGLRARVREAFEARHQRKS